MKLGVIIFLSSIVLSAGIIRWGLAAQFSDYDSYTVKSTTATPPVEDAVTPVPTVTPTATPVAALPESVLLDVPFTSQAPFSKWDALHQDACEEASFLMVKYFLEGKKMTNKQEVDDEIIAMVRFEESRGYGLSITLTELNTIVKDKYNITTGQVKKKVTIEAIKRELAAGHPVIIGAAGRLLNNPNFTGGGPVYHMLVIKGYDADGFITNDPGTRLGEHYRYSFATIDSALHDWSPIDILNGERNMLVYY